MVRFRNSLIRLLMGTYTPRAVKIIGLTVLGIWVGAKVAVPLVTGSCPDVSPTLVPPDSWCIPWVTYPL